MFKIVLENISKKYPNGKLAADKVSFEVNEGEFVVLVGPSGCGKSTVLRMIAGLEEISRGKLFIGDKLCNDLPPKDRNVGMVFQNYALYPHLSVYDNLAFPLRIQKDSKSVIKSKVESTASNLELTDLLARKPKELSGGQRQRVALGRALVKNPKIFLFDEPLSNLDAKLRAQMRTEIVGIHRKIGAISVYVTHDQVEAMTMADRIVVMKDGIIKQIGSPGEIYANPVDMFTASFLGSPQMNFFEGTFLRQSGLIFKVAAKSDENHIEFQTPSGTYFNYLAKEFPNCILGIRPEKITPAREKLSNEISFQARIDNVEFLGRETIVYFRSGDSLMCARIDGASDLKPGEKIFFNFDTSNLVAFEQSGARIFENN